MIVTLEAAHERAAHGDRILRVAGVIKGRWFFDHILNYVHDHGTEMCWVTEETDSEVAVCMLPEVRG